MEDTFPKSVPGPSLAELRRSLGVGQADLARRLGMHRVTLYGLERAAVVDPIRAARYQRALREIVDEAVAL
jgi:DNA-binding XRE family transcriptional regulator